MYNCLSIILKVSFSTQWNLRL